MYETTTELPRSRGRCRFFPPAGARPKRLCYRVAASSAPRSVFSWCTKPVGQLDPETLSTLTWGLRCQEQNRHASSLFGRYRDVMSGTHGTSWQPLRTFRHTTPVVPPVADGPDVSPISACGDGEPEAIHTLEKTRTTNITRHEAEPAFSGSVIVATSLHAVDPNRGSKP